MYRIEIDRSLCSGYGMCIDVAPELIELDDDCVAVVRADAIDPPTAIAAAKCCPMGAITVVDLETRRAA